ncbi:hypothetical protein U8527_09870 [Kordia algicida OT-1]|uniref:HTH araC/xylS-type domain-containing protein n=1 Tax=Kordia algicida OT-1 TaxID=391587 RepID=A9DVD8_9FLAO|nr:hypothetical protein [Kordia algicida]EDP96408.1 hypothetical protein KAOT1_03327 [Kordia algicida OT-1]
MNKGLIYIYIIISSFYGYAQDLTYQSLKNSSLDSLREVLREISSDTVADLKLNSIYLKLAKEAKDTMHISYAYRGYERRLPIEQRNDYWDSIIQISDGLPINFKLASYSYKAYNHLMLNEINESLSNFLTLYELSKKYNNIYQQHYSLLNLTQLKFNFEDTSGALDFARKNLKLVTSDEFKNYVIKTKGISRANSYLAFEKMAVKSSLNEILLFEGKIDSARYYLNLIKKDYKTILGNGIDTLHFYEARDIYYASKASYLYNTNNYEQSITYSDSLLTLIPKKYLYNNIIFKGNYFKGMSYSYLKQDSLALKYLKNCDSLLWADHQLSSYGPYLARSVLNKLYLLHKKNDNAIGQIDYLNKTIAYDSLINTSYGDINYKILKHFELPEIIETKDNLIKQLKFKKVLNKSLAIFGFILFGLSLIYIAWLYRKFYIYNNNFNKLIQNRSIEVAYDFSAEKLDKIFKTMDEFEINESYLKPVIRVEDVFDYGINTKTLNDALRLRGSRNFSDYINRLKVNYAFVEITNNIKYHKSSTLRLLAEKSGFTSQKIFNKKFIEIFGFSPMFYVKKLNSGFDLSSM